MAEDPRQFVPFLKTLDLFSSLADAALEGIAARLTLLHVEAGQPLFTGRAPEDDFYIVRSGTVVVQYGKEGEAPPRRTQGQHFTEEDLLYGQPDSAIITAEESADLLHLDEGAFYKLLADHPGVKPGLARTREAQMIVRRQDFDWIGEDEVIYFLARKHEAMLIFSLAGPFAAFGAALALLALVSSAGVATSWWTTGAACSGLLALGALLWGAWNFIDWGNDYYIVTNQRAVWVEKVIWLYESRDEAPLNTILAVNTRSTFLGRLLGYGTVVVRTFTGEITFRNLPTPNRMAAIIEEYRHRFQSGSERLEKRRIEQALRERLWRESASTSEARAAAGAAAPVVKPGPLKRFFSGFFTMRFEKDGVITYRKYWPTLIGKIWLPALFVLLVLVVFAFLGHGFARGTVTLGLLQTAILVGSLLILLVFFPWWLYMYVDWRNDIYQVTDKYIFDIERRPLGTEIKKSAPLENILSLEHKRKGFLGYILNYGYVTINVGETQFVFRDVHEPARVQQDIFNRIYAQRRQKEQAEAAKDRQHLVDVIEIYHRNVEESREEDIFNDYEQDFGVELGSDGYP